ncbi:NAD(P)-binding domain-containing protein [Planosporangium thailandense]|uniref:NAD(P)-binding domain-containing protein n=1 Tax=Planosporangium thailandense TaxID=765197 RepID=A0ABX0Y2Y9_9ACTN|nr:NAD(P)-binding domain-containing protein [Planosporangium thailandense]NJC72487.1 NAD(P)-binding domain-containing protein [Planosporangium thailandense]
MSQPQRPPFTRSTDRRIAIIGSGRMGRGLVRQLAPYHQGLLWGSRDPQRLTAAAAELGVAGSVEPADHDQALRADVVILALWHRDAVTFADRYADALAGRIVVDIANPFTDDFEDFTLPETTSAAEELARRLPGASVVGAFKNTFWVVLDDPDFPEGPSDVLVTGDDPAARRAVIELLTPLPFRVLDAGRLANNRTIERMTLLGRELAVRHGHYPRISWRLLGAADEQSR